MHDTAPVIRFHFFFLHLIIPVHVIPNDRGNFSTAPPPPPPRRSYAYHFNNAISREVGKRIFIATSKKVYVFTKEDRSAGE